MKIEWPLAALALPVGTGLLLTGHATAGLIAFGVWVLHMAIMFPIITSVLQKRDRGLDQN